jgi:hypothetical protein
MGIGFRPGAIIERRVISGSSGTEIGVQARVGSPTIRLGLLLVAQMNHRTWTLTYSFE